MIKSENEQALEQLLYAYNQGEINWTNAPKIQAFIQQEITRQVKLEVQQTSYDTFKSQFTDQLNQHLRNEIKTQKNNYQKLQNKYDNLQKDIKSAENKATDLTMTRTHTALGYVLQAFVLITGIVGSILAVYLGIQLIFSGGISELWNITAPHHGFFGFIKAIFSILLIAGFLAFISVLIGINTYTGLKISQYLQDKF